jgi:hypothetical protein
MAQKFIHKILSEINENPDKIVEIAGQDALVRIIFENAFNPANKWILPEGIPPYKKADEPDGMFPSNMYLEARRIGYIFKREDLKPLKREGLFIEMLESVSPEEANILIHIKEQKLYKLYPNITPAVASKVAQVSVMVAESMIAEQEEAEEKAKKPHQAVSQKRGADGKFLKKANK